MEEVTHPDWFDRSSKAITFIRRWDCIYWKASSGCPNHRSQRPVSGKSRHYERFAPMFMHVRVNNWPPEYATLSSLLEGASRGLVSRSCHGFDECNLLYSFELFLESSRVRVCQWTQRRATGVSRVGDISMKVVKRLYASPAPWILYELKTSMFLIYLHKYSKADGWYSN